MKKTIAQQLNIKDFPFVIDDKNGNQVYYENSEGYWMKGEYDKNGNQVYFEDSVGYWEKREYDQDSNQVRYENSNGRIEDKRSTFKVSIDDGFIEYTYAFPISNDNSIHDVAKALTVAYGLKSVPPAKYRKRGEG